MTMQPPDAYPPSYPPPYQPLGPPWNGPAPVAVDPRRRSIPVDPMPVEPVVYQQLLRGPRYRWWKPLLCLLLLAPIVLGMITLAVVPVVVAGLVTGAPDLVAYTLQQTTNIKNLSPVGFVYTNLSLIVLIPAVMISVWVVHGTRPRFVASVAGGIRWAWLLRCVMVVAPVWLVYVAISLFAGPPSTPRPDHWLALLVIVLLMTPLQAAGEEYLFRGWIMQNIGSWFARPILGLVVSLVVSCVAFSAAHLSPDPFVVGTLACLAVTACIATWRTGGLEAAIVIHAVNNVLSFFVVILFGGWQDAFVTRTSTAPPATLVAAIVIDALALSLILWQARKVGIGSRYAPTRLATPYVTSG